MRHSFICGTLAFVLLEAAVRVAMADEPVPPKILDYQQRIESGKIDPQKVKKICEKIIKHRDQNLTGIHDDRCGQVSETLGLDAGNDCGRVKNELLANWGDYLRARFYDDCGALPRK